MDTKPMKLAMQNNNACVNSSSSSSEVQQPSFQSRRDVLGDLLSSKIYKMSQEERSDGLHDLHGVADIQEETTEFLRRKVDEMNQALDSKCERCCDSDSRAYQKAVEKSRGYVEKLKIPFLRAQTYDSREAADHIIRFFDRKMELFGEQMLDKDIEFKDLGEEATTVLNRGLFQLSAQRDRAGRAILFIDAEQFKNEILIKNEMRALYYMSMAAVQDDETQKKGLVVVSYANRQKIFSSIRPGELLKSWNAHPTRVVALHICTDTDKDKEFDAILDISRHMESKKACRFRVHNGSHMDALFKMMTFGIPSEALPVDTDGSVNLSAHKEMMKVLMANENERRKTSDSTLNSQASSSPSSIVLAPGPLDILMGRGRHPKSSLGGLRMRQLLLENWLAYEAASKSEKTRLAGKILMELKASGCRFRSPTPHGYEECDDQVAREKISHSFRNLRLNNGNAHATKRKTQHESEA